MKFNAVLDVYFLDESGNGIEPITLNQVKDWLKIDTTDEDSLLNNITTAARILCEQYTNISFIQRKVIAIVNNSLGSIELPYSPIGEILDLQDVDGNELTDYEVTGVVHKRLKTPEKDYLRVKYTAGFTTLPQNYKTALLTAIAYIYEHRGDEQFGELSPMAKTFLKPLRRVW